MTKSIFIFLEKKLDVSEIIEFMKSVPGFEDYKSINLKEKNCIFCKIDSAKFASFLQCLNDSKFKELISIEGATIIS